MKKSLKAFRDKRHAKYQIFEAKKKLLLRNSKDANLCGGAKIYIDLLKFSSAVIFHIFFAFTVDTIGPSTSLSGLVSTREECVEPANFTTVTVSSCELQSSDVLPQVSSPSLYAIYSKMERCECSFADVTSDTSASSEIEIHHSKVDAPTTSLLAKSFALTSVESPRTYSIGNTPTTVQSASNEVNINQTRQKLKTSLASRVNYPTEPSGGTSRLTGNSCFKKGMSNISCCIFKYENEI